MSIPEAIPDNADESSYSDRFVNFYRCPADGTTWADSWSATCNDRCPKCGREIEPYKSEDL